MTAGELLTHDLSCDRCSGWGTFKLAFMRLYGVMLMQFVSSRAQVLEQDLRDLAAKFSRLVAVIT